MGAGAGKCRQNRKPEFHVSGGEKSVVGTVIGSTHKKEQKKHRKNLMMLMVYERVFPKVYQEPVQFERSSSGFQPRRGFQPMLMMRLTAANL